MNIGIIAQKKWIFRIQEGWIVVNNLGSMPFS